MKARTVEVSYALGALLVFAIAHSLAMFVAAPIGGGEYHLVFAYSGNGRIEPALYVYAVSVGTLAALAMSLLSLRYPVRISALLLAACVVGMVHWWGIATWRPQSTEFHRAALVLLALVPACVALPTFALRAYLSRHAAEGSAIGSIRPGRWGRRLAWIVLFAPAAAVLIIVSMPAFGGFTRTRWRSPAWLPVREIDAAPRLSPETGVVFEGPRARSLLAQCSRETPGWTVSTWNPSRAEIDRLERDLASFLVHNDTGRTRPTGFKMPPLNTYYRQYGGLVLLTGRRIIYVNGVLPGFFTEKGEAGGQWRAEAVSVCGGWQAYFGVEYDPTLRRFRGFSYN